MQRRVLFKIVCCILTIPMVFGAYGVNAAEAPWYEVPMNYLLEQSIIDAPSSTPNDYITREEFCVMVSKAYLGLEGSDGSIGDFADASKVSKSAMPYLAALYESGFLKGVEEKGKLYIKPNDLISRQDAFTFIGRAAAGASVNALSFADSKDVSDYAAGYISRLAEIGVVKGYPDKTVRPNNNLTIAETYSIIYNIKTTALLEDYAGTGLRSYNDGARLKSGFALPYGICAGADGSLVVFDTYNALIRTIAGEDVGKQLGDASLRDEYGFAAARYFDGMADKALFGRPSAGVVNYDGKLYIADTANNVIRFVKDNYVYTFSGSTKGYMDGSKDTARFNAPSAMAVDSYGAIYVADTMNHCIRRIAPDGTATTIAGVGTKQGYADGAAGSALFCEPSGIAINSKGEIFVADTGNHVIRKISGGYVTTVAGLQRSPATEIGGEYEYALGGFADGSADKALFNYPMGMCFAGADLVIADSGNHAIRVLTEKGGVTTIAGTGEPGDFSAVPLSSMMNKPSDVCYIGGTLYIADTYNNKIKFMKY